MSKKRKKTTKESVDEIVGDVAQKSQDQIAYEKAREKLINFNEELKKEFGYEIRAYTQPVVDLAKVTGTRG